MITRNIILSIVFGSACSLTASGQIMSDGTLPPDTKVTKGMFDTYETGDKMYWSVPDSLFDREYSVTTTILSAPESSLLKNGFIFALLNNITPDHIHYYMCCQA